MLQKAKWRLTLINISVIGGILLIFTLTIYWGSPKKDAAIYGRMLSSVRNDGTINSSTGYGNLPGDPIYIKIDSLGQIEEQTSPKKYSKEQLQALIQAVVNTKQYSGIVELNSKNSFHFIKVSLDKEQGTTILVLVKQSSLMAYLIKSGTLILITLVLIFVGSLFLSDKALRPARRAWQRQIDFTADASHELRTPITIIQTNLELVLGNPEETINSQKKWLNNIWIETKRLGNLVNDLLTLSRADTNQQTLITASLMLDTPLREAILLFETQATNAGISLSYELEPGLSFWGDADKLKQLMIILIDNALLYTNRLGQIHVQLCKLEQSIEITVADTGVGIASEHLENIFERFYRIDKVRGSSDGGSGLGLAIAKWIVKQHHGTIRAESTPGEGTTFRISLPIV